MHPVHKRRVHRPPRRPCGKVAHDNAAQAARHIASLVAAGADEPWRGPLHAYRCPDCGAYHVGHTGRRAGG